MPEPIALLVNPAAGRGRALRTAWQANDAAIAQTVVVVKEELEKIREQLQNIE